MLDVFADTRDSYLLGESVRRRPVLLGPALSHSLAVRRPDPTRQLYSSFFPGYALHEKGSQRQGNGPLVSS